MQVHLLLILSNLIWLKVHFEKANILQEYGNSQSKMIKLRSISQRLPDPAESVVIIGITGKVSYFIFHDLKLFRVSSFIGLNFDQTQETGSKSWKNPAM